VNDGWVRAEGCKRRYPKGHSRTCYQECGCHLCILPSALARGIGSQSVARDDSKCCMYIYIYVRHTFGMQLNFCDVIATSRLVRGQVKLKTTPLWRAPTCQMHKPRWRMRAPGVFTFVAEQQLGRGRRDNPNKSSLTKPKEGGKKMNALEEKFRIYKNHRSEGMNWIRMPCLKSPWKCTRYLLLLRWSQRLQNMRKRAAEYCEEETAEER